MFAELRILGHLDMRHALDSSKVAIPTVAAPGCHAHGDAGSFAHLLHGDSHQRSHQHWIYLSLAVQDLCGDREGELNDLSLHPRIVVDYALLRNQKQRAAIGARAAMSFCSNSWRSFCSACKGRFGSFAFDPDSELIGGERQLVFTLPVRSSDAERDSDWSAASRDF